MNDDLTNIWRSSGQEAPKVLRAADAKTGDRYLVIEDKGTIYKLMDENGNFYLVASFRCALKNEGGKYYYSIISDPIHPISCGKLKDPKDIFAFGNLKEYVK